MIEKWKKVVDNGGVFETLLTDLSKAFDYILHDFIITKLETYGFDIDLFLTICQIESKDNDAYSSWKDIFCGVPQGSILGPLLFDIHLGDLFCFLEDLDIASCADDTTIYMVNEKKIVSH